MIVADALCHHGADGSSLHTLDVSQAAVARALLFRMATTNALAMPGSGIDLAAEAHRYTHAAPAIGD